RRSEDRSANEADGPFSPPVAARAKQERASPRLALSVFRGLSASDYHFTGLDGRCAYPHSRPPPPPGRPPPGRPPPGPPPPPPPPVRGACGFEISTVMRRPSSSRPLSWEIAFWAPSAESISTKPKPRDWPENRSVMTVAERTLPLWAKNSRRP